MKRLKFNLFYPLFGVIYFILHFVFLVNDINIALHLSGKSLKFSNFGSYAKCQHNICMHSIRVQFSESWPVYIVYNTAASRPVLHFVSNVK